MTGSSTTWNTLWTTWRGRCLTPRKPSSTRARRAGSVASSVQARAPESPQTVRHSSPPSSVPFSETQAKPSPLHQQPILGHHLPLVLTLHISTLIFLILGCFCPYGGWNPGSSSCKTKALLLSYTPSLSRGASRLAFYYSAPA